MTRFFAALLALGMMAPQIVVTTPALADGFFAIVVDSALQSGNVVPCPLDDTCEYHILVHLAPADQTKDHTADYFSVVTVPVDGHAVADHVEVVSEKWTKGSDGVWKIDQWLFTVSLDGTQATNVMHNIVWKKADGILLTVPQPKPPTDAEATDMIRKILAPWLSERAA